MHVELGEGISWEPIGGDDYLDAIHGDDDEGPETTRTNTFLKAMGKHDTTRSQANRKTTVGQRRTTAIPKASSHLHEFRRSNCFLHFPCCFVISSNQHGLVRLSLSLLLIPKVNRIIKVTRHIYTNSL